MSESSKHQLLLCYHIGANSSWYYESVESFRVHTMIALENTFKSILKFKILCAVNAEEQNQLSQQGLCNE